jgi:hypothetical protein
MHREEYPTPDHFGDMNVKSNAPGIVDFYARLLYD